MLWPFSQGLGKESHNQTLVIGYGRWADPIVLDFNRVPAYKEVNNCQ